MTKLSPTQLASKVVRESTGISVRIGQTNGEPVLHLVRQANEDAGRFHRESRTIPATEVEWNLHPWNEKSVYA